MSLQTEMSALGHLKTASGSLSEQPGASSGTKQCPVSFAYKRGSVGAKTLGGELIAWQRQTMQARGWILVMGKELKRKEKAEVTIAFSLLPNVQPHLPIKEFPLYAIHCPHFTWRHIVRSPVYPLVKQKYIVLCIDLERKKSYSFLSKKGLYDKIAP